MKFQELEIPGAWLIEPELVSDERGVFRRHFCTEEFQKHGIDCSVSQGNISENPTTFTLRGFHFQIAPYQEGKTISCITGGVYDIIVDLRPSSKTYLKWTAVSISANNRKSLHIPTGCANAYLTMEPNTTIHYYMSQKYVPESYRGFSYDDPAFYFVWPMPPRLVSKKDLALPLFDSSLLEQL